MKNIYLLGLLLSLLSLSCSHDEAPTIDPDLSLKVLAQSDRDSISNSVTGYDDLNSNMQLSITAFFEGSSGEAFQKFLDNRIHFFITKEELVSIEFDSLGGQAGEISPSDTNETKEMKDKNIKIAASNVGTPLWINASANGRKAIPFSFQNHNLVLDSGRVGLMLIGDGYNMSVHRSDGSTYVFPAAFRQSILIHEARHSDCPTGLNQKDLDFIKTKKTYRALSESFEKMTCGNLHSFCPSGPYKDLPACDRMPWGAYTAGAMFANLGSKSMIQPDDRRVMEMIAADQLNRVLIETTDMFAGKLGPPDLTSRGFVN